MIYYLLVTRRTIDYDDRKWENYADTHAAPLTVKWKTRQEKEALTPVMKRERPARRQMTLH